jgi:hypothetical protein
MVIVDGVDCLGGGSLLTLAPEFDRAQAAQKGCEHQHHQQHLGPAPPHKAGQATRSGGFGQCRKVSWSLLRRFEREIHLELGRRGRAVIHEAEEESRRNLADLVAVIGVDSRGLAVVKD